MQRLSFLLIASLSCFALGSCKDVRLGVDGVDAGGAGRGGGGGAAGAGGTTSSTAGTTGTGGATSSAAGTTGTEGATSSAGGTTITGGTASSTGGTTSLTGGTTITGGSTRATGGTTITGGSTFTTLASGLNSPSSLVVDATNVYFINGGTAANNYADGTLMKVPIAGGKTTTIASGQRSTTAIAGAGTNLYWTNWGTFVSSSSDYTLNTVMTVPLVGGTPVTLASGQNGPQGIAVDSTYVYWTNASGTVMKMPVGGGTPVTLASGLDFPGSIAVDATSVYWVNGGTTGKPYGYTTLMKIPIGGGAPTTLASAGLIASGSSIAVDPTSVYWTINLFSANSGTETCTVGTVTKVSIDGGTPITLASGELCPSGQIAVDATAVYWVNSGQQANGYTDGSVMAVPLTGGTPITVAAMQDTAGGLAIDAASVYWTIEGTADGHGAVLKTAKIPFDCNLDVASKAIAALGLTVVGNPQTLNFTLPAVLTTDDEWGLKAPLCQDGGYDITPLAGKSACIVGQATTQRCDGYPANVWVLMSNGAVKCVYKSSGAGNPGVYSATSPNCTQPTIAAGATVLCGATSCTSATGPCCPAETMMNRLSMCMPDCSPAVTCDGPEDCGTGQVCCSLEYPGADFSGASCVDQFNCIQPSQRVICHQNADCPSPQHCGVPNPMPAYVPDSPPATTMPLYWGVDYQVCAP